MQKATIQLAKIEIKSFNPKDSKAEVLVHFIKNSNQEFVKQDFILKDPMSMVKKTLIAVKSKDKFIVDETDDDILANIYITQLLDEDETEERLLSFYQNICSKVSKLRTLKIAGEYMKLVDEIKSAKFDLSQPGFMQGKKQDSRTRTLQGMGINKPF